jgi:hypothetical protein
MKNKLADGVGADTKFGGLYQDDLVSIGKPSRLDALRRNDSRARPTPNLNLLGD